MLFGRRSGGSWSGLSDIAPHQIVGSGELQQFFPNASPSSSFSPDTSPSSSRTALIHSCRFSEMDMRILPSPWRMPARSQQPCRRHSMAICGEQMDERSSNACVPPKKRKAQSKEKKINTTLKKAGRKGGKAGGGATIDLNGSPDEAFHLVTHIFSCDTTYLI